MNLYEKYRKPESQDLYTLSCKSAFGYGENDDRPADVEAFELALRDYFIDSFNIEHLDRFKVEKDIFQTYEDGSIDYGYWFIVNDIVVFELHSLMPKYDSEYVAAFDYLETNKKEIETRINIVRIGTVFTDRVCRIRDIDYMSPFETETWYEDTTEDEQE